MKSSHATAVFLRILAVLQLLTGLIALAPLEWIAAWYAWLGLGVMPHDPVLRYVIRGGAWVQGGLGVLFWIMATDVIRYRPLVLATAGIFLAGAPSFYFIEVLAHMPRFWIIIDAGSCLVVGGILLELCLSVPAKDS